MTGRSLLLAREGGRTTCAHWNARTAIRFHQCDIGRVDRTVSVHIGAKVLCINGRAGVCFCLADVAGVNDSVSIESPMRMLIGTETVALLLPALSFTLVRVTLMVCAFVTR